MRVAGRGRQAWLDCVRAIEEPSSEWHTIHMKRTNLVLREDLLQEAVRLSGERTYSRTVERALEDLVRRIKARQILELAGSGAWAGDLSEMRRDRRSRPRRGRRAAR
jgi:Arc/MetJ family transcription regulator